ncbi:hypothetical protein OHA04_45640 (plasmid) [Streptomyces sp. NBC_01590]|uniref:hypothetical protein n=1 Tax=Streptomyces sp. NBC_01590 TaxID=2975887 RepID=UPI002F9071DF
MSRKPDWNASAAALEETAAEYDRMAATSTGLLREIAKDNAATDRAWAASYRAKAKRQH